MIDRDFFWRFGVLGMFVIGVLGTVYDDQLGGRPRQRSER